MMEEIEQELEEQTGNEPETEVDEGRQELEAEAKKYGWRPKEDYDNPKGPDGWVDADRFMELPSTHLKIARDEKRELLARIEEMQKGQRSVDERIEALSKSYKVGMDRALEQERAQHKQQLAEVRAAQRQAFRDGDEAAYDRFEKREIQLLENPPKEPELPKAEPQNTKADEYDAYVSSDEGKWMQDPYIAKQAAEVISHTPKASWPGDSVKAQADYAKSVLMKHHPEWFGEVQKKPTFTKVDGGGLAGGSRKKGVNSLPADALRAGKDFVAEGVFKTLEDYAEVYHAQEG